MVVVGDLPRGGGRLREGKICIWNAVGKRAEHDAFCSASRTA